MSGNGLKTINMKEREEVVKYMKQTAEKVVEFEGDSRGSGNNSEEHKKDTG